MNKPNNKLNFVFLFVAIFIFSSCKKDYTTIESNGNIVTKEIELEKFNKIQLTTDADVKLKNGTTQKVTISISDNIIDQVNTTIVDGMWTIDTKKGDSIATINNHKWEVIIESPNIDYIENDGSESITSIDTLTNSPLIVRHLSGGSTSILCNVSNLTTFHDGGGTLTISGVATVNNFTKAGGGDFKAFNLNVNTYNMTKDGGGNCEIKAISEISGTMEGGGNVYYKGTPTINVQVDGGGQLIDAN